MKKEEKNKIIKNLVEEITNSSHFYLTDTSGLNSNDSNFLRRKCFEKNIKLIVVKNTLLKLAFEKCNGEFEDVYNILKGPTAIMLSETGNMPAKIIKNFRKKHKKPILKAAYVEESFYVGDDKLDILYELKSKEELIGDIIALLQSPAKNVVSALQSSGGQLAGIVKTLSERPE